MVGALLRDAGARIVLRVGHGLEVCYRGCDRLELGRGGGPDLGRPESRAEGLRAAGCVVSSRLPFPSHGIGPSPISPNLARPRAKSKHTVFSAEGSMLLSRRMRGSSRWTSRYEESSSAPGAVVVVNKGVGVVEVVKCGASVLGRRVFGLRRNGCSAGRAAGAGLSLPTSPGQPSTSRIANDKPSMVWGTRPGPADRRRH